METIDDLFKKGIAARNVGDYHASVKIFLKILKEFPNDPKTSGINSVLAGVYFDLKDYKNSLILLVRDRRVSPHRRAHA